MAYNSHILRDIYRGEGLGNFVYTTRPLINKKLGGDIAVIYLGAFIGVGGLRNFVNTRPLFNKKLGWDITVIYLGHLLWWGLGNFVYTRPLFKKKLGWDITVIY